MAITLVNDLPARDQFVGDSVTVNFPCAWPARKAEDVTVLIDGAAPVIAYSISGLNTNEGFVVSFDTAPDNGAQITIARAMELELTTNFTQQGKFFAQALNSQLAAGVMMIQQVRDGLARSLQAPITDTLGADWVLPDKASRAGAVLAFDSAGNPVASFTVDYRYQGALLADPTTRFDGSPLQAGDEYFSLAILGKKVWTGAAWSVVTAVNLGNAASISYDNATSSLTATQLQAAVDEVDGRLDTAETDIAALEASSTDYGTRIGVLEGASAAVLPPGVILPYSGATTPAGYLLCYGQAVSRTTYSDLFAAIGTAHGTGDGSTTFNVPDLRGRVVGGRDDMGGVASNRLTNTGVGNSGLNGTTLGAVGGVDRHTLTTNQLAPHAHGMRGLTESGNGYSIASLATPGGDQGQSSATESAGGGQAHPIVQPTIILNYIVKT